MQQIENTRIKRLEALTRVDETPISEEAGVLIAPGEEKVEGQTTEDTNPGLPLMAMLIVGIAIGAAAWMFIIYLGIGTATVNQTLGNHFLR